MSKKTVIIFATKNPIVLGLTLEPKPMRSSQLTVNSLTQLEGKLIKGRETGHYFMTLMRYVYTAKNHVLISRKKISLLKFIYYFYRQRMKVIKVHENHFSYSSFFEQDPGAYVNRFEGHCDREQQSRDMERI